MSEVSRWVQRNASRLSEIASDCRLEYGVVHLLAVMVLAGLSDEQVKDQLEDLVISIDGDRGRLDGAPEALGAIRALVDRDRPAA